MLQAATTARFPSTAGLVGDRPLRNIEVRASVTHQLGTALEAACIPGERAKPMKVPRNIMGRMNMKASPVADPDVLATEAVIRPNPTQQRENVTTITKAIIKLGVPPRGEYPINSAIVNTRIT